jgi:hypothetical protein
MTGIWVAEVGGIEAELVQLMLSVNIGLLVWLEAELGALVAELGVVELRLAFMSQSVGMFGSTFWYR